MIQSRALAPLLVGAAIVLAGLIGYIMNAPNHRREGAPQSSHQEVIAPLTHLEEAAIRNEVYDGVVTCHSEQRHEVVCPSTTTTKVYERKPIAVLSLYLEIVRGGRPDDALSATALAVALAGNPGEAVFYVFYESELVDQPTDNGQPNSRQDLIRTVNELLLRAHRKGNR